MLEETLSAKDKKEIPDSMYGLIYTDENGNKIRKFPLNDESHVRQAAIFFDRAKGLSDDQKRELARNIIRRAKELDMDYSGWESLKPYLDKPVKESYDSDPDSTSGTSDFDDNDHEPDDCYTESFEEMFGPVIQEAYDAVTGEEIPIDKAYTLEEMKERTLSLDEVKSKDKDGLIPVKPPKVDEVYFGSPTNHMPEIDLNRPLFVTPYKGIASIFIWGDMGLQDRIPRGTYNHNYEEWIRFDEKKMKNPLKEVHVYVEGAPFLEPFAVEQEGYIHCISTKDYLNNFFRKPWMTKDLEYLIANTDNMKVEFTRSIKCKVKYYIKGRPSPKGKQYGPSRDGILQYIHKIAKSIHAKYEADQKEPTGNQNCLLCAWCAEASIRGGEYLPRPVYSPRDPALEIVPGDIVGGVTKKNPGNFYDMLEHLRGDSIKQPFARWYCHVKWGHGHGGHEFLIVKTDEDAFNIMDPQQGIVRPLHADDSYMKNVDWEGTYICRIDDKPFKYMKLDQINDPKKTLPWDPKKDIPYMVKHGLCTKEEAEKELKKWENNKFTSELKKALNQTPIQEAASDPVTIIPKDLRDWLEKGDYSSLEKDDSYYYVEGHPVEEFFREPEFCKGYFYPDEEDDPILHCIVFSDDNGNGLVYDWTDECYYYAYHDWIDDDTGFLHRERLSSKSWSIIVNPTHIKKFKDQQEKSRIASEELKNLKSSRIYGDISHASNKYFGKGIFKSDLKDILSRWYKMGLDWCNDVIDFAEKYDFPKLKESIEYFENHSIPEFSPSIADAHGWNVEAYKEGAAKVIAAFNDVEDKLSFTTIQEGLFFKKKEYHPLEISEVYQEFVDAYNDSVFKAIISEFKDRRSSLLSKWMNDTHPVDGVFTEEDNDGLVSRFLSKTQVDNFEVTNSRYETIGYGFATVRNPDEWLTISKIDGKVYYCDIRPDSIIADSFNEFLSSFGSTFKQYLTKTNKPIQEGAWNDIRNGVNPWSKKRVFHITQQGHLDGQIFNPRVPEYLDKYDPSKDKFEDVDNPRVCFSPSIEGALNAIMVTIGRWKSADKLRDWYVYIPEKPLKEYKYRTTKQLVDEKKVYDANVTNEIWIEEPVRLKQYGIIRVDQVSDKHIKKTVPTTTGFTGHRYRYDFKYHWLVKPKVIADIPYDYTPMGVCKDMVDEGYNFKYGLGANGSVHKASPEEYDKNYRLESPEEFENNGGGICFDFVEWQAGYLEAYGYTCKKYFISTETDDNMTHTFILVDDGNGKLIYPEISFELLQGVHEVKSPEEAVRMIIEKMIEYHKTESIKYYVWEYSGHPPYGSDMNTCLKYYTKGEPFHEGSMNKPEKIKRKD